MKKILYTILALATLASCVKEPDDNLRTEYKLNLSVSCETRAGGSGSGNAAEPPIINNMRVLIFYGSPSASETAGNMLYNTFFDFGYNVTKGTGEYTVSLANPIVLPQSDCRNYEVYVVFNEDQYLLQGSVDLHSTLKEFAGTVTALNEILDTPAAYAEVLKNVDEPAFLMSASTSVNFASGELGSVKPVVIEAGNTNKGRSMAQIVVNKITSEPIDGVDYSSNDVPLVFVKSITLENVPDAMSWSDVDGKIGTVGSTTVSAMTAVPVGEASSDGYYTRDWYGHVTRTITNIYAQKVQYTDARFYRCGNNAGGNSGNIAWSFNVKPYRTTDGTPGPGTAPYTYVYAQGDDVLPKLTDEQKKEDAIKGLEAWAKGDKLTQHSTKVLDNQISGVFDALQDDNDEMSENITFTSYEVTGVQSENKDGKIKTSIGPATLSDDYWTVRLGDIFYVPENIQNATGNATCIRVRLAIAEPKFSFSLNKEKGKRVATEDCNNKDTGDKVKDDVYEKGYNYVDPATLPSPSSLPGEAGLAYTYYAGDNETGNLKKISDIDANWVKAYGSIVWADNENHLLEPALYRKYKGDGSFDGFNKNFSDNHGQFYTYIDGFSRRTEAVQTEIVVNETLRGSHFDWNVPAATHVYDFVIPVNNNIGNDGDYSVRRNTRYTVTLYVNQSTYDDLETKSGANAPFTVNAVVKTERVK